MGIAKYRFDELAEGMSAEFSVTITQSMMQSFAELSGDYNPLHLDADFAKSQVGGGGECYAYGMLLACFYSRLCGMYLPGENCLLHSVHSDFKKPVFVGDELVIHGQIIYLNEAFRCAEIQAKTYRLLSDKREIVGRAKIVAGCLR